MVDPDCMIEPYNMALNDRSSHERGDWADDVIGELSIETDIEADEFVILAGKRYREFLIDRLPNHKIPLEELSIGKHLSFYSLLIDEQIKYI